MFVCFPSNSCLYSHKYYPRLCVYNRFIEIVTSKIAIVLFASFLSSKTYFSPNSGILYFILFYLFIFIHNTVYMSIPIAQFSTPPSPPHRSFPPLVSICLFSTSVSQLLPCNPVYLYHFSRFHIHALIYNICFSLSDLLHSV